VVKNDIWRPTRNIQKPGCGGWNHMIIWDHRMGLGSFRFLSFLCDWPKQTNRSNNCAIVLAKIMVHHGSSWQNKLIYSYIFFAMNHDDTLATGTQGSPTSTDPDLASHQRGKLREHHGKPSNLMVCRRFPY
jgi:hypothetical protein